MSKQEESAETTDAVSACQRAQEAKRIVAQTKKRTLETHFGGYFSYAKEGETRAALQSQPPPHCFVWGASVAVC